MSETLAPYRIERPAHAHYYVTHARPRGHHHLVTARRMVGTTSTVDALCGRRVDRIEVLRCHPYGHRHVTHWIDRYGDDLCAHCVRIATTDDEKWRAV